MEKRMELDVLANIQNRINYDDRSPNHVKNLLFSCSVSCCLSVGLANNSESNGIDELQVIKLLLS